MSEQLLPGARGGVAGRHGGDGLRPLDRQIRIVVRDRDVLPRIVWTVDAIAHISCGSEGLETMQEPRRDVEVPELLVVEPERLPAPERGRIRSDVDDDVVDRTVGTSDELRLAASAATVHTSNHTAPGTRLGVLDESRRCAGFPEVVVEDLGVERPGEQATFVTEWVRHHHNYVSQLSLFDAHETMLP